MCEMGTTPGYPARNIGLCNLQAGPAQALSFSIGTIWEDVNSEVIMEEMLAKADQAM